MKVCIVGPSEEKWTPEQKAKAKNEIEVILKRHGSDTLSHDPLKHLTLVSGHCPKGGIDIYAETIANELGIKTEIHAPEVNQWEDLRTIPAHMVGKEKNNEVVDPRSAIYKTLRGYKSRNIDMAKSCDVLYCIASWQCEPTIIEDYKWTYCKHCKTTGHIGSGGCYTMKYAKELGKETHLVVIE